MNVSVDEVTVEYRVSDYTVRPLNGLSLRAEAGELVVVLGASGCGKTTLLSVLAGILTPSRGRVTVGATEVTSLDGRGLARYRRHEVGVVFQAFNLVPSLTALENVQAPLRFAGVARREAKRRAHEALARVDLADRESHRPGQLSGGQQQRVAIARAIAHDPGLLLADEPTAHLDYVQVEGVLSLIRALASSGRTVIMATHDERLLPLADRVIELTPRAAGARPDRERITLNEGDVLFSEGDPSDFVYEVIRGEVEVVQAGARGRHRVLATVGPGRHVGELGPLLGLQRSATVRARERTTLRAYTPQAFRSRVRSGPERRQSRAGR